MTDAIRDGAQAAAEFGQTEAAFDAIREAMISRLLKTGVDESVIRDKLVSTIQALDLVREKILSVVQAGRDAKALDDYAAQVAEAIS